MKTARGLPVPGCVRAESGRIGPIGLAVAAALYGVAAVQVPPAFADPAASSANPAAPVVLEPIVVTATKVAENVQDVPEAIQVLTTKAIENLSITHFEDFATKMPTVSFVSDGPTEQTFYMRGVSDGSSANASNTSTTGYFLDDAATSYYGEIPDLHLYDIDRIEVLDGPQGTLYGAGAMSGAIRIITNKPNWNAFSAGIDLDGGKIQNAGRDTTEQGFVNIPLIEGSTALRLSGYLVHDGGFIDNVLETQGLAEWSRLHQCPVGAQRLQHGEGVRRTRGHRAEDQRFLEGHSDRLLSEPADRRLVVAGTEPAAL